MVFSLLQKYYQELNEKKKIIQYNTYKIIVLE